MQIARVCGNVVSTLHHPALDHRRVLLVQPMDLDGTPRGAVAAAVDVVDAGPGDWVLVLDEGASASQVLGIPRGPVRTLIVGVVDLVTLDKDAVARSPTRPPGQAPPGPPGGPPGETPGDAAIQDGTRG